MITAVLVDDQPMIRLALKGILQSSGEITVVGEADRGAAGVEIVRSEQPDVVLMDLRMPGMDGVEAIRLIRSEPSLSAVRILVLTTFESDENVVAALEAGADGFLGKGAEPSELISGVRAVAGGAALLSPGATRSVLNHLSTQAGHQAHVPPAPPLSTPEQVASLTTREWEILRLVGQGLSNEDIADALYISPFTVKTHINRSMQKLGVSGRAQLVRIVYDYELGG